MVTGSISCSRASFPAAGDSGLLSTEGIGGGGGGEAVGDASSLMGSVFTGSVFAGIAAAPLSSI